MTNCYCVAIIFVGTLGFVPVTKPVPKPGLTVTGLNVIETWNVTR